MSDNRHDDGADDRRLREAYRDLSTERAPSHLDKSILRMAKKRGPDSSLAGLMAIKPLAWAATIVLTVTLVLQLEQTEVPETLIFEDDVVTNHGLLEIEARQDTDLDAATDPSEPTPAAGGFAAPPVRATSASQQEQDSVPAPAADMSAYAPAEAARSSRERVEELVVEQKITNTTLRETAEPALGAARKRMQGQPEPRYCDETETANAASWYQCILRLEEDGRLEEARSERTRLFSDHPDFQVR